MSRQPSEAVVLAAVDLATRVDWPAVRASGWLMHAPFAAWLTNAQRPTTFVELGTHYGFSYFTICETARTIGHDMHAYAVDHWRGDEHAGAYGEDVYDSVSQHNAAGYDGWSTLLRMDFDLAADRFGEGTVDLLHIDGFHTYEAVSHDFSTWRRTLSNRAVVLFHDVREYQEGFGVHRFWDEIRRQYPSFTFSFGHGLGVLAVGADLSADVRTLCSLDESDEGDDVRRACGLLGAAVESEHERYELAARSAIQDRLLKELHSELDQSRRQLELVARDRQAVDNDRVRLDGELHVSASELAAVRSELQVARHELAVNRAACAGSLEALAAIQKTLRYKAAFGWRRRLHGR